jgi:hypothetical protein
MKGNKNGERIRKRERIKGRMRLKENKIQRQEQERK